MQSPRATLTTPGVSGTRCSRSKGRKQQLISISHRERKKSTNNFQSLVALQPQSGVPGSRNIRNQKRKPTIGRRGLLAQDVRRMQRGQSRPSEVTWKELAALSSDSEVLLDQVLRARRADAQDHERLNQLKLRDEPLTARTYLFRRRSSVHWLSRRPVARSALDRVANVHASSVEAVLRQGLIEKLPGAPYERSARSVFLISGPLPDKHKWRQRVPLSEDNVSTTFG